ncbi:MAG: hypothetical protein EP297_03550 [Gammaproteobacteria bacterium]|nr:MAG: hypothetical protein EP297_03550 [Gammaproteobacteria bacterium]
MLGTVLALFSVGSGADVPDAQMAEITHLLNFVRSSDCTIDRNGKKHDGESAYSHIMKKYNHFRDRISSTEEFIAYSATKSTMSGKHYLVFCGTETPQRTEDWLLQELSNFRARRTPLTSNK